MSDPFLKFRENIIGINKEINTPFGTKKLLYADWIASGRLYGPIEKRMIEVIGPYVGNTHTETSETGTLMTKAYHLAHKIIKKHVNASSDDVIITSGVGMTGVINKFQRILGLRICSELCDEECVKNKERPVVFITHMEHHSNHTSWFETHADLVQVPPGKDLLIDLELLRAELEKYKDRKFIMGSFTACSNVTGIVTPYYQMAKLIHEYGGYCFIDFAASAPYVDIDMHPADPMENLDAIFFSPHKFLGGPGSSGVLIFNSKLYKYHAPDQPGGGTVEWTNPWGEFKYIDDIEVREDGGTPGFLQAIKVALSIKVKDQMGTKKIKRKEEQLLKIAFRELKKIKDLHILAENATDRLGIISFYFSDIHYNLVVKLLNDLYGVQVRGGCACAGTYGHYLLNVSYEYSHEITEKINSGDLSEKPGWIRLSLHPTMTKDELLLIINGLKYISDHAFELSKLYEYNRHNNEFRHKKELKDKTALVEDWFEFD